MPQTFGQAKKILARYASAYDLSDVGSAINTAVDELSTSKNWQKLKRVKRFTALGQYFPLPQDCDSVVRACVDGVPIDLHGADYDFLYSGPGDLDYIPAGFAPLNGLQDQGYFPTMYDITDEDGVKLCAFGTDDLSGMAIRVKGKSETGTIISGDITYKVWEDAALGIDGESAEDAATATASDSLFCEIDKITLPEGLTSHVYLYALSGGVFTFLSFMHPFEKVPEFRRYRMAGFSDEDDASYRVLAEVKLKPVAMVNDWDPMPFDSLLPVQYMLQSMWYMNSGEVKAADDYRQRAFLALAAREDAQQERQGIVILNTRYEGSLGQASVEDWQNV